MRLIAIFFVVVFGLISTSYAQEPDEAFDNEAIEFALNNSTYVLYHEMGHLLIGELGIPVLGKEEDAADNLATIWLLVEETETADQVLVDSSDGWFLSDLLSQSEAYEDADFYDSHSLDVQRAFQLVCLMVGSDAEIFGEVATNAGLERDRQEECEAEFVQTLTSWDTVLAPYTLDSPHDLVRIAYEPSTDFEGAAELLQQAQSLEGAAQFALSGYDLPRPVQLIARECGEANAYYDPDPGEIVFCYELVEMFYGMFYAGFGPDAETGPN